MLIKKQVDGKMRHTENILRMGKGEIKENDGGVNSTKIHCNHFGKCHNVSLVQ
jgi:hypothetical protein